MKRTTSRPWHWPTGRTEPRARGVRRGARRATLGAMWRGGRRRFGRALAGAAAALVWPRSARPSPVASNAPLDAAGLELRDVSLPGAGKRMVLLVPTHLPPGARVPLLVLHHGLGETGDARMGSYAWVERYGLAEAYARLRRPPSDAPARRLAAGGAIRGRMGASRR